MANQGKPITGLNDKGSLVDTNDQLVIVYNAANSELAQTALISVRDLLANSANVRIIAANLAIKDIRGAEPADSAALTVPAGTLFFTANYGYVATSNNLVKRFAISSF